MKLNRKDFFKAAFGAAGAAALTPIASASTPELRDDDCIAVAKLDAGKRYILFVDPTRIEMECLLYDTRFPIDQQVLPLDCAVVAVMPKAGMSVKDAVAFVEHP